MCRWIAYAGAPVYLEDLLFAPENSLIDQSLSARAGTPTTNGDGFGVGWYGTRDFPGLYRDVAPAWNDRNLRALAGQIRSPLFFAHVRAATGTAVQQTNCHPFHHGRWLFMHNGHVAGFPRLRRALLFDVAPDLFDEIGGTTDTEVLFHLALTFGLVDDPVCALERAVGLVEARAREAGIPDAMQGTFAASDGERLWAVRYSTEGRSRSLYCSRRLAALGDIAPFVERFGPDARAVVSEPLDDLTDLWQEVPEATALVVEGGEVTTRPFAPRA